MYGHCNILSLVIVNLSCIQVLYRYNNLVVFFSLLFNPLCTSRMQWCNFFLHGASPIQGKLSKLN